MKKFFLFLLFILTLGSNVFAVEVSSPRAILIDVDTGRVLFQKNAYEAAYPASTTKVLTAILVLENCELDEMVTASATAVNSVYANGTTASIQPGEELSVRDLLSTMLIHSANDAAYVLAEHVGGTIDSFSSMLNAKAKELGAKSTYFLNPNGLPNAKHKCSAYDMSLFARYAMQNFPVFREIVSTVNYTLPITEKYTELYMNQYPDATNVIRYLNTTTNHLINPNRAAYYYEYATGIKTGYTDAAANCIVASAKKDGVELIVVIFGASGWTNLRNDAVNLFEYGFGILKSEPLAISGTTIEKITIENGVKDANTLDVIVEDTLYATLHSQEDASSYTPKIALNSDVSAPIAAGQVVGTITYTVNDIEYTSNLIAGNSVEVKTPTIEVATNTVKNVFFAILKLIFWCFIAFVLFIFAIVLIRAYIMTKRQRRRSRQRYIYNNRFR